MNVDSALDQMRRRVAEGARVPPRDPLQQVGYIHVPGLAATPWHDRSRFPWAADLDTIATEVRGEFDALEAGCLGLEEAYGPGTHWRAWMLHEDGVWNADVVANCPTTIRLIERGRASLGDFFFAELGPGGFIDLHSGGCNAVLSVHLPLIVPEGDCAISVGTQTRRWTVGEIIAFDDSYIHSAWNDTDRRRVVLVWEIFHPDLSDDEAEALRVIFRERAEASRSG